MWTAEALKGHDASQHQSEARCGVQEERPNQAQQPASAEQPLLFVNMSALKGDEEMRRMFGRDIVQLRNQEDQAADLGEAAQAISIIYSQAKALHAARLGISAAAARFGVSATSRAIRHALYKGRHVVLIRYPGKLDYVETG